LNPRRTFQHVRDFQSRSLDHSDTSPWEGQRTARRRLVLSPLGVQAATGLLAVAVLLVVRVKRPRRLTHLATT
jgi:hypothetical protein